MTRFARYAALLGGFSAVLGCELLAGVRDLDSTPIPPITPFEPGSDATTPDSAIFACPLAKPPPKPTGPDQADAPPQLFAIRRLTIPVGERAARSYDLDDSCTCDQVGESPAVESKCTAHGDPKLLCDLPGGRDNGVAAFVNSILVAHSRLVWEARLAPRPSPASALKPPMGALALSIFFGESESAPRQPGRGTPVARVAAGAKLQ